MNINYENIYQEMNLFFQRTGFTKDLTYKEFCKIVNKKVVGELE